ncbi:MAG: hypothetical protein ACRDH5_19540, partial [bacterium]
MPDPTSGSVNRHARAAARTFAALALLAGTAGCLAPDPPATELRVTDHQGQFVVLLELVDGRLSEASAWWVDDAPELDLQVGLSVPGWHVLVLKDDVVIDRAGVLGTPERAFVVWKSSEVDV